MIERLQANLGIERIFEVARKSASLMKDKNKNNILYRNNKEDDTYISNTIQPRKALDNKISTSILKDLDNRETSTVQPQYRPAIDKLIENFALLYAQTPTRFVSAMLGRKSKSSDKSDSTLVDRLILKERYVNEETFNTMLHRIDINITPSLSNSFFNLLCETKHVNEHKKHNVVDLWGFFTLLKTANEQARRSFDGKTSKIANDVSFWEKSNNNSTSILTGKNNSNTSNSNQLSFCSSTAKEEDENIIIEKNKRFNSEMNQSINHSINHLTNNTSIQGNSSIKKPGVRLPIENKSCVAEILGREEHRHMNYSSQGRCVKGYTKHDFLDHGDISSIFLLPYKDIHPKSPIRAISLNNLRRSHDDSILNNQGSDQVGAVLGLDLIGTSRSSRSISTSRSASRPFIVQHTINREIARNETTVSELLGNNNATKYSDTKINTNATNTSTHDNYNSSVTTMDRINNNTTNHHNHNNISTISSLPPPPPRTPNYGRSNKQNQNIPHNINFMGFVVEDKIKQTKNDI